MWRLRTGRSRLPVAALALGAMMVAAAGTSPALARAAPEWAVSEWINGDPGPLENHRGRVVLLHFFQLWCPGCNHFSIPLFHRWEEKYGARDDVLIISIHSVFEGHSFQSANRLHGFVADKEIDHPVGIDDYADSSDRTPITMRRYRTGGTPQVVIIDKKGEIRFSHLGGFDSARAERLIDQLLREETPARRPPAPKPDFRLSGTYRIRLEQSFKSCGPTPEPLEIESTIAFFHDRVEAQFPLPFLGIRTIIGDFDPERGSLQVNLEQRVDLEETSATLILDLHGRTYDQGERPEIEMTFRFRKIADDPAWDCEVDGELRAERISGVSGSPATADDLQ